LAIEGLLRQVAILTAACVFTGTACGRYHGTVVDDETGRPLEGAVVAVVWCKRPIFGMDRPYYFHNAHEAVTDRQGRFSVTAFAGIDWSPTTMTESSPEIAINMLGYRPVTTYTRAHTHKNLERELLGGTVVRMTKLSATVEQRGTRGSAIAPSPRGHGQFLRCWPARRRRRLCCGFWICSAAVVDLRLLRPCLLKPPAGNRELRGVRGRVFVNREGDGADRTGVLPTPVREAPSRGEAPPRDHHRAADLPDDMLALLDHHHLDLGGTYGDPEGGKSVQARGATLIVRAEVCECPVHLYTIASSLAPLMRGSLGGAQPEARRKEPA